MQRTRMFNLKQIAVTNSSFYFTIEEFSVETDQLNKTTTGTSFF